jgi:hypothetical protein
MGGEDIDFPNGSAPSVTAGVSFRTGYGRCALQCGTGGNASTRSLSFVGGTVTSAWLHAQLYVNTAFTNQHYIGLGLNSAGNKGVFVGSNSSTAAKCVLYTWDGSTATQLAAESGSSLASGTLAAIDMQITSYGASSTVNVYINGTLAITFSGSTAISGVSNLDCVLLGCSSSSGYSSEIIVADADTRSMSLLTQAPNAAGDANNWTNAYTNINPVSINDANVIFVNTTAQDFQANLIDLPSGTFTVQAVKAAVRAEVTAGSTPTSLKIGVKTGGTVNVDAGRTPTAAFTTYERLMNQSRDHRRVGTE